LTGDLMQSRWGWLLLSIALAETVNLGLILVAWMLHRKERNWKAVFSRIARIQQQSGASLIRLLYAVGLPAFAYISQGALTARGLGLQSLGGEIVDLNHVLVDWAGDIGWALAITVIVWLIVSAGRIQAGKGQSTFEFGNGLKALREALYHQVHWAFYREPFVLTLGLGVGSWVGASLAALEALTNPGWWADIRSVQKKEAIIYYGAILTASTLLYGLTGNLWVAILADSILRWGLGFKPPSQAAKGRPAESPGFRVSSTQ